MNPSPLRPEPDPIGPGQESVWAYPRPPIVETSPRQLEILHREVIVARTQAGARTLETSHPPTYYFPRQDIDERLLRRTERRSFCEWKGWAVYFDVEVGGQTAVAAAWSYPDPTPAFALLKDRVAFYAAPFDLCTVDGERTSPQPGGFYGGWITSREAGPFKGVPGSRLW